MGRFSALAGAGLLLSGTLAQAQGIGYDYVDLGYRVLNRDRADTLDDTYRGPAVRFSMGITDSIYGLIENAYLQSHGPDVDIADLAVGFGYRQALAADMDFFGEGAWMRRDVDTPSRVDDRKDDGYQLAAGVRFLAMEMLELNLAVLYRGGVLDDNEAMLRAGGVWSVYGPLGVQASAAVGADSAVYDLGLRISF